MTGLGFEPTTCGLKGHKLAPASAGERQFKRVFEVRALTSASQRRWALSPWYNADEVVEVATSVTHAVGIQSMKLTAMGRR
jgi:hypothetical protein